MRAFSCFPTALHTAICELYVSSYVAYKWYMRTYIVQCRRKTTNARHMSRGKKFTQTCKFRCDAKVKRELFMYQRRMNC